MRRLIKVLGFAALGLAVLLVGVLGFYAVKWPPTFPDTPLPAIEASSDPAVIERGGYIVDALAHCGACHSTRERYTAAEPGQPHDLSGGLELPLGPLGTIRPPNITPDEATGIGSWTDAEIARAIRHGVHRDGRGLLYMMTVGPMSDEDLVAVVSYLRSLEPVTNQVPPSDVGILGKVLFQTAMDFFASPHDYSDVAPLFAREGSVSLERGRYLAMGPAACMGCHSDIVPKQNSIAFDGPIGAGNSKQPMPDLDDPAFEYAGPNLSSDPETGHLAGWSREQFVTRMYAGRMFESSPMPWETYRNMTREDLESLWLWVQSIPPTKRNTGPLRREAGWKPPS